MACPSLSPTRTTKDKGVMPITVSLVQMRCEKGAINDNMAAMRHAYRAAALPGGSSGPQRARGGRCRRPHPWS